MKGKKLERLKHSISVGGVLFQMYQLVYEFKKKNVTYED